MGLGRLVVLPCTNYPQLAALWSEARFEKASKLELRYHRARVSRGKGLISVGGFHFPHRLADGKVPMPKLGLDSRCRCALRALVNRGPGFARPASFPDWFSDERLHAACVASLQKYSLLQEWMEPLRRWTIVWLVDTRSVASLIGLSMTEASRGSIHSCRRLYRPSSLDRASREARGAK